MSISTWQTQTKWELWGVSLRVVPLMLGLWGMIFQSDPALMISLSLFIVEPFFSSGRWMSALMSFCILVPIVLVSQYVIGIDGFSPWANGMIIVLFMKSAAHIFEVLGASDSLLEKMVKSGEF